MWLPFNTQIWLYRTPIDFRKQIDGLVLLVADTLHKDPTSGQLFVFRNRQRDKIKLLYWADNGFWLLYKRQEKGRLKFPDVLEGVMELTGEQLQWLLTGLDFERHKVREKMSVKHFY